MKTVSIASIGIGLSAVLAIGLMPPTSADSDTPMSGVETASLSGEHTTQGGAEDSSAAVWQASIADYTIALLDEAVSHDNFTGSAFDNANHAFLLYGVGEPGGRVQELMDDAPGDVNVHWESVPYSKAEMDKSSQDVLELGAGVIAVGASADFKSLEATAVNQVAAARFEGQVDSNGIDVPVDFTVAADVVGSGRGEGSAPFKGGSRVEIHNNGVVKWTCSTAFRAYRGSTEVMLTAAHCSRPDATTAGPTDGVMNARLAGDDTNVGTLRSFDVRSDSQLIIGQSYGAGMWQGPALDSSVVTLDSSGAGTISVNEALCGNGGYSGTQCGTVTQINIDYQLPAASGGAYYNVYDGAKLVSDDMSAIWGQGDSGGPVYKTTNTFERRPAGIISAIVGNTIPCPAFDNGRLCSKTGYFVPWANLKDDYTPTLTLVP